MVGHTAAWVYRAATPEIVVSQKNGVHVNHADLDKVMSGPIDCNMHIVMSPEKWKLLIIKCSDNFESTMRGHRTEQYVLSVFAILMW